MKRYWFYLESYTFVSLGNVQGLIYNSVTSKGYIFSLSEVILKILKRMMAAKNMYCIQLTEHDIVNEEVISFIQKIKELFCGDIIDVKICPQKPIILYPRLSFQKELAKIVNDPNYSIGEKIYTYLRQINIYINSTCNLNCSICKDAYKQFIYCYKQANSELDLAILDDLLFSHNLNELRTINVLGGNIFLHSQFKSLVEKLDKLDIIKHYYIHYNNCNHRNIKLLKKENNILQLLVDNPVDTIRLNDVCIFLRTLKLNFEISVIIEDENDFITMEGYNEKTIISKINYLPYFNGKNISFFQKNIFFKKADLFSASISKNEIFAKEVINMFDFGKISITSNGDTHSNMNLPKIGSIYKNSLGQMLVYELKVGTSWRRTRNSEHCNKCIFKILCPSPSNYDFVFDKINLCNL